MKKYFALVLTLVMLLSFAACGGPEYVDDPHALETADTYYEVNDNGVSINLTEDTAKTLLGVYSAKQLGLKKTIDQYNLKLSESVIDGQKGFKVEAFAEGSKKAEGVFGIVGTQCYVYNAKSEKYIPLSIGNKKPTESKTTSPADTIPDDPDISFQYHKENNYIMQQRFSGYDYKALGLSKEISAYVFVVNGNSGYAVDGEKVYYVDVYEKNG